MQNLDYIFYQLSQISITGITKERWLLELEENLSQNLMFDKLFREVQKEINREIKRETKKVVRKATRASQKIIADALTENFIAITSGGRKRNVGVDLISDLLNLIESWFGVELSTSKDIEQLLAKIDRMPGRKFEEFLCQSFKQLGYTVQLTPAQGDFGADLVVQKKGMKMVVQAKRYQSRVGIEAVQQILGAKGYYRANRAMVITNSQFTSAARKLASHNQVELWDRQDLKKLLKQMA